MKSFLCAILVALLLTGCAEIKIAEASKLEGDEEIQASKTIEVPLPVPETETDYEVPEVETDYQVEVLEPLDGEFVLVTDYLPEVSVELMYALEDNFTGQVIYTFNEAWLRYGTVKKLIEAQELLGEYGYGLKIWDAFRPVKAQFALWEVCPDPRYVANPEKGYSSHSRGNTVDITLVDGSGNELIMPTGFDDFTELADRDYSDVQDEKAAENAKLLENVMISCGFNAYFGEWWHFSDSDTYPVETEFIPD